MPPSLKSVTLDSLTNRQHSLVKGHLVDMANRHNECISPFAPLDSEFSPGLRVIDYFSDHILFNVCDKDKDNKAQSHQLNEMVLKSSSFPSITIIASDASIKNNVTISIIHIHTYNKPLTKMIHHAVLVTSTKTELFAIRCGIVATTCRNSTHSMLTSAKLSNGLSSSGDYKRTRQGVFAAFIYYIYT